MCRVYGWLGLDVLKRFPSDSPRESRIAGRKVVNAIASEMGHRDAMLGASGVDALRSAYNASTPIVDDVGEPGGGGHTLSEEEFDRVALAFATGNTDERDAHRYENDGDHARGEGKVDTAAARDELRSYYKVQQALQKQRKRREAKRAKRSLSSEVVDDSGLPDHGFEGNINPRAHRRRYLSMDTYRDPKTTGSESAMYGRDRDSAGKDGRAMSSNILNKIAKLEDKQGKKELRQLFQDDDDEPASKILARLQQMNGVARGGSVKTSITPLYTHHRDQAQKPQRDPEKREQGKRDEGHPEDVVDSRCAPQSFDVGQGIRCIGLAWKGMFEDLSNVSTIEPPRGQTVASHVLTRNGRWGFIITTLLIVVVVVLCVHLIVRSVWNQPTARSFGEESTTRGVARVTDPFS